MTTRISKEEMKSLLNENHSLRNLLFPRGFLLTNDNKVNAADYPFYNNWISYDFFEYRFLVHPNQKYFSLQTENVGMTLIGHAYNPLTNESSEDVLLRNAIDLYCKNEDSFTEYFNQWSGSFALFVFYGGCIRIYGDAAGMYTVFYGVHKNNFYCSSHTNLLGDVCELQFDPYVEKLINYKFYHLFGKALPGDISPYLEFKRLIPNHFTEYKNKSLIVSRFFPTDKNSLVCLPYEEIVNRSAEILSSSMRLIYQKWNKCAISLTGGCDSKTTLSCANGVYDKYNYFSYISSDSEAVDAEAAEKICCMLGLKHHTYNISEKYEDFKNIDAIAKIMEYNSGNIGKNNPNDIRKRAFFLERDDFDVEVKSWVSEIARAYYHKRFNKTKFPKSLTPEYATTLYKVFFNDRKLIHCTDKIFAEFLEKYYINDDFLRIPWYDMFFWEFRMSSWNGLVITGEQQICFDITIPYNNRCLLQLMLSTPVSYRVEDTVHKDIIKLKNKDIANSNISVVNVKHTKNRAKLERLYLDIFSKLHF